MAPKKTSSVSVVDGKVTVNLGIRMSADFQSASFDVGLTLPLEEGESPDDGLSRVSSTLMTFLDEQGPAAMNDMADHIKGIKASFKQRMK